MFEKKIKLALENKQMPNTELLTGNKTAFNSKIAICVQNASLLKAAKQELNKFPCVDFANVSDALEAIKTDKTIDIIVI